MHICQFNYRSISNNCKGSNHWNIIRHMNKCIENQGPSHLLNIGIYSFSYLKQTHSKWNLQSSQTRSVGAWQCLTSGQHGPKHHFQINSLTCRRIETQSQLLHSVHHIFWVVLILTQEILTWVSLSSPALSQNTRVWWENMQSRCSVSLHVDSSASTTTTLLSPFLALV